MSATTIIGEQDIAARDYVRKVTRASGSTFYWGMRILPEDRRDAMFAIYAFCREVDDIADGPETTDMKLEALGQWRQSIEEIYDGGNQANKRPLLHALTRAIKEYSLDKDDFIEVISGMEMDADGSMIAPDCIRLQQYCERVAGAVGLLSIRIFGDSSPKAKDFAVTLGTALQLTNILRDIREDAKMGRVYLPLEQLRPQELHQSSPEEIIIHPKLPEMCLSVAMRARDKYREADCLLRDCNVHTLKPAIVMMMKYRRMLERLINSGWQDLEKEQRLPLVEKFWITCRYGFLSIK